MTAYYNEIDPYAAQWLRNLIAAGHIAPGDVDERDIRDVRADDLEAYTQCHFFAGIGGWSYALRLAGWPDDRPVWTGSCPCQPFSVAGAGIGFFDERHLWPAWFSLVRQCKPSVIFGEQVEAAIRRGWLDAVFADLESEGYACGAAVLPACSVGAPHIRQRLWFISQRLDDAAGARHDRALEESKGNSRDEAWLRMSGERSGISVLADACSQRRQQDARGSSCDEKENGRARRNQSKSNCDNEPSSDGADCSVANGDKPGLEINSLQHARSECASAERSGETDELGNAESERESAAREISGGALVESDRSFWAEAEWLLCRDNKSRPTQPGLFPLAHGIPARVGKLRAAGNAIVPQVAAKFIIACEGAER